MKTKHLILFLSLSLTICLILIFTDEEGEPINYVQPEEVYYYPEPKDWNTSELDPRQHIYYNHLIEDSVNFE